jgi:hypothetical protein
MTVVPSFETLGLAHHRCNGTNGDGGRKTTPGMNRLQTCCPIHQVTNIKAMSLVATASHTGERFPNGIRCVDDAHELPHT